MRAASTSSLCVVSLTASLTGAACRRVTEDITLTFPSDAVLRRTTSLAVSIFEPILTSPDQTPRFVACSHVSVFPPMADVDPGALGTLAGSGEVLKAREDVAFTPGEPVEWEVSFPPLSRGRPSNPWGVVTVYVEARGDARTAGSEGQERTDATLAAGCYCLRTQDGTFGSDPVLDQRVKAACDPVDDLPNQGEGRILELAAVAPPAFELGRCDGLGEVAAPRNAVLSPGPAVCLSASLCSDSVGNRDCFACEQPCEELGDLSRAPVLFTVVPARQTGRPDDDAQVVLTDEDGRARPTFPIQNCPEELTIRARVLGSPDAPVDFSVTCVDEPDAFSCVEEQRLGPPESTVVDMTVLPISTVGGCTETEPAACDRVVALSRAGPSGAVVEVRHRDPAVELSRLTFENEEPQAVQGFLYDAVQKTRPALAVVTADPSRAVRLRVYAWLDGRLQLVHGPDDLLMAGRCATWRCGSGDPCGGGQACPRADEVCRGSRCVEGAPCDVVVPVGASVVLEARRLDTDAYADLVVGSSAELPVAFFYSEGASSGRLYRAGGCECARFGQPPTALAFITLGGSRTPVGASDLVFGSGRGSFVQYASSLGDRTVVSCGGLISLRDTRGVRDVARARLRCAAGQAGCDVFEDAIILSEQGSGGGLEEPGFIRVLYGGPTDLGEVDDPLSAPGTNLVLHPRVLENRADPRDPRSLRVADFNGDGFDDVAVLYRASQEVHLWYGSGRGGLGEGGRGVILDDCPDALDPVDEACPASAPFATPDQDGNGRSEIVVSCRLAGSSSTLRYFEPVMP